MEVREGSEWVALAFRGAMGLEWNETPTVEHLERLIEQDPACDLRRSSGCAPYYAAGEDGRGVIWVPLRCTAIELAHEYSHAWRGDGLATFLRVLSQVQEGRCLWRLARLTGWSEEAGANALVIAMFLPITMVYECTDYQLSESTGLNLPLVGERRWAVNRFSEYHWDEFAALYWAGRGVAECAV